MRSLAASILPGGAMFTFGFMIDAGGERDQPTSTFMVFTQLTLVWELWQRTEFARLRVWRLISARGPLLLCPLNTVKVK